MTETCNGCHYEKITLLAASPAKHTCGKVTSTVTLPITLEVVEVEEEVCGFCQGGTSLLYAPTASGYIQVLCPNGCKPGDQNNGGKGE